MSGSLGGTPLGGKRGLFSGQFAHPNAGAPEVQFGTAQINPPWVVFWDVNPLGLVTQFGSPALDAAVLWLPTTIGSTSRLGKPTVRILGQPTGALVKPTREQWVAQRVAARYQERGDPLILRRTTLLPGEVGFVNPPLYAPDIAVSTVYVDPANGQIFFGLRASSLDGRLRVGDRFTTKVGVRTATWFIDVMPGNIQTDSYGAQLADPNGAPLRGTPQLYAGGDALSQEDQMMVIPVVPTAGVTPFDELQEFIGSTPSFIFQADEPIYGTAMSLSQMIEMGWTESQDLGVSIAGTRTNGTTITQLKVDDQVIINDVARNIMQISTFDRRASKFLYQLRLR